MGIWHYSDWLHPCDPACRITLGEGNTPLIRSRSIGPQSGLDHLYFKLENVNPSGSYKDRFAAAAISDMLIQGKRRCIATTSGNTGSALAAYCAAAGLACQIAIVIDAPASKLKQMLSYGARLYMVEGFGQDPRVTEETFETVKAMGNEADSQLQISAFRYSPVGMTGVQTIGYELADTVGQIGRPIDHVFVSAGGGGLTLAIARGLGRAVEAGRLESGPAVHCVQPQGNNTIAGPLRDGVDRAQPCDSTTKISGLQVPSVIDGHEVIAACRASAGSGHLVSDEHTWQIQTRLAREEGIFCEPAAAVATAGVIQAAQQRQVGVDEVIVSIVTGSGFKDETSLDKMVEGKECPVIDLSELRARITAP